MASVRIYAVASLGCWAYARIPPLVSSTSPAPDEAMRILEQKDEERRATHIPSAVAELNGVLDVLPLFRAFGLLADDQSVADQDMEAFADLKQSWWDWNSIVSDLAQPELVKDARRASWLRSAASRRA
jgi:hypothetical protein